MTIYSSTDHGNLPRGGRLLVIGASGGCGIAGLQLAQYLGASEVIGVSSDNKRELVLREGATGYVDYTTTNLTDRSGASSADIAKFDVVYDCASGSGPGENYKTLALTWLRAANTEEGRKHGQYVAINGPAGMWLQMFALDQKTNEHLFLTDANTKDLNLLAQLVDDGWSNGTQRLNPIVMKVLPLTSQAELVRCLWSNISNVLLDFCYHVYFNCRYLYDSLKQRLVS